MTRHEVYHSDPDILGGTPVFTGTRVPVQNLLDYLAAGRPLAEFLEGFPGVTRRAGRRLPCAGEGGRARGGLMRVLLDENLDWRLRRGFDAEHDVMTVQYRGWSGMKNVELLRAAEAEFDVFVTLDSNLKHQQNVASLDLAIVVIRAASADVGDVESALPEINALLPSVQPGRSYVVGA